MRAVYLDHASTTPLHPAVVDAMLPYLTERFGNPSSIHRFGREAFHALNRSRDAIADMLGCSPSQLIFTGSGTESDNLAIFGSAQRAAANGKKHIVTSQIEHPAVMNACRFLQKNGFEVTYVSVDRTGKIRSDELERAIRPDTGLISIMYVNNETGTVQDVAVIGEIARAHGVLYHVDAVQALGYENWNLRELPVDFASFSAHKIYGPKGVGLLYAARRETLGAMLHGGRQEKGLRAGTENVAGIVGFAAALELAQKEREERLAHARRMRQSLLEALAKRLPPDSWAINGHPADWLPHILNVSFFGVSFETMVMNLDMAGVAVSSGSACSSGSLQPSHVLAAMGADEERLRTAIRFSFGRSNTDEDIEYAAEQIAAIVHRLKK